MNEEERSNLYIYTYSDLDDDFVFAETKYTLGDLHKLQQENQKHKEVINKIQKEINGEYSIMGVKVVENYILEDIIKEVE